MTAEAQEGSPRGVAPAAPRQGDHLRHEADGGPDVSNSSRKFMQAHDGALELEAAALAPSLGLERLCDGDEPTPFAVKDPRPI